MKTIRKTIEVDVPVRIAYNQWANFENVSRFMPGVSRVERIDGDRLRWIAQEDGHARWWESRIYQEIPHQLIEWHNIGVAPEATVVRFIPRGRTTTEVQFEQQFGIGEAGGGSGGAGHPLLPDLQGFKDYVEIEAIETSGWRYWLSAAGE